MRPTGVDKQRLGDGLGEVTDETGKRTPPPSGRQGSEATRESQREIGILRPRTRIDASGDHPAVERQQPS